MSVSHRPPVRAVGVFFCALLLAGLVPAAQAGAPVLAPPPSDGACTSGGDAASAAEALYGAGTELVRTETVEGLRSALVLEPRIAPGTRRRMLAAGSGWCDASSGFNRAWTSGDGRAAATAFASVAAAPYFDGVSVTSVRPLSADTFEVRTHALTNGVDATWLITADAAGVRTATWTATAFAQAPLVAESEGLTALPGASETYLRLTNGVLAAQRGLPTAETARAANHGEPSVPAVYEAPDGMQIRISVGDTRVAVDPGTSTGAREVDMVQETLAAVKTNYEEFLDWGLEKGWEADLDPMLGSDVGWVYLNDALSLYCLACVFIADDFQIHMLSEVARALELLGFDGYGDDRLAYTNIIGHEMFHNFQNAYNEPGPLGRSRGRGSSTAYSEGTARFQETLHSYSDVSFAPRTLYTGGQTNPPLLSLDANHCNGYRGAVIDTSFAAGPFGRTYDACYFWTSWYVQNGLHAFVDLVAKGIPAHSPKPNAEEGLGALAVAAPGVPVADQLAFFARSALTGSDRAFAPASGDGATRDWGTFLFRWDPPAITTEASRSLGAGGVFARRLDRDALVSLTGGGLLLYEVRAGAAGPSFRALDTAGAFVAGSAPSEPVWVVAVNPTATAALAVLKAADASAPNRAPLAVDDAASTGRNRTVAVNVLANDSDPDGDALHVTAVSGPAHGTMTWSPEGEVRYDPAPGFTGTETLTYTVTDARGAVSSAALVVTVKNGPPDKP